MRCQGEHPTVTTPVYHFNVLYNFKYGQIVTVVLCYFHGWWVGDGEESLLLPHVTTHGFTIQMAI